MKWSFIKIDCDQKMRYHIHFAREMGGGSFVTGTTVAHRGHTSHVFSIFIINENMYVSPMGHRRIPVV